MMERDDQKTLAAAGRSIESERKAHKSYICGRQDLPRMARWFGFLGAAGLGRRAYFVDSPETLMLGYLGAAALGPH
jgi:hypothetical protein